MSRRGKRESREDYDARMILEEEERSRLENRSLYERIEDCETIHDVKEVLHFIVDELDTCLASRGGFPWSGK